MLKWFIALLLPLTFLWKLTLKPEESIQLKDGITTFLIHQKFDVSETKHEMNGMPVIRAGAKTCRMFIMRASPDGWNRDLIRNFATATDHIFIIFEGKIYHRDVSWTILASYLQSEILYRLGLARHVSAVIAVVAPPVCDIARLPWVKLGDF